VVGRDVGGRRLEVDRVVVADLHEVEADLLGPHGLADHLLRRERLRDELETDLHPA
jgi:hypothetical protein